MDLSIQSRSALTAGGPGTIGKAIACEFIQKGVRINQKRRGHPEEVAAVVALLASERSSFVVGANYRVDGGSVIGLDT